MAEPTGVYIPNIVPTMSDNPELERFLADELERISLSIRGATVQPAYGGMCTSSTGSLQTITTAYSVLTGFDTNTPTVAVRVTPDATANTITVLDAGVYMIVFDGAFTITNDTFNITLFEDGVETICGTTMDSADQKAASFNMLKTLAKGTVLDVRAKVDAGTGDLTQLDGNLSVFRVSESLG